MFAARNMLFTVNRGPLAPMILIYNTTLSPTNTIEIPLDGVVDVTVDWGDGNVESFNTGGTKSHTYNNPGTFTVSISGSLTHFGLTSQGASTVNASSLTSVTSFGNLGLTSLGYAFNFSDNLTSVPTVLPNTVTNLQYTFNSATNFNSVNVTGWDVSNVTNMTGMFYNATNFNRNISGWCVTLISTSPDSFDTNSALSPGNSPVWGTCPSLEPPVANFVGSPLTGYAPLTVNFTDTSTNSPTSWAWDFTYDGLIDSTSQDPSYQYTSPGTYTVQLTTTNDAGSDTETKVNYITVNPGIMTLIYDLSLGSGNIIEVPLDGTVDVVIDWGDGNTNTVITPGLVPHEYSSSGIYTVTITGILTHFGSMSYISPVNAECLTTVVNWDNLGLTRLDYAFNRCFNLTGVPSTLPPGITSLKFTFAQCYAFNDNINSWDVSSVTTLEGMFVNAEAFNQPLNSWNTSNVTDMAFTFNVALAFNQPLNNWNTSNVTTLESTFDSAEAFNQNINNWNTSNVTNMLTTFAGARSFNQPLNNWNVSNVTDMTAMFQCVGASGVFNQNISNWCVSLIPFPGPSNFSLGVPLDTNTSFKPVWGTCPS